MKIDYKRYEAEMVSCIERAVCQVMDDFPDEHFYAAALHDFYREQGDRIALPCLAANTAEEVDDDGDNLWSSPDWYWADLEFASKKLLQLHRTLEKEAGRLDTKHWNKVHQSWMNTLVRVAKQLTRRLKQNKPATKDFGFFLFDSEGEDVKLLRRCMSAAKFKRLFPALHELIEANASHAKKSVAQRLATYSEDLYEHGIEIIKQGKAAIPVLLECLDSDQGWCAAGLLAKLGFANDKVIQALRHHASLPERSEPRVHYTAALAILGDIDFLLDLASNAGTRDAAIDGIKKLYGPDDDGYVPVTLDYSPLERLLQIKSCSKKAQRPCSGGIIQYALPHGDIYPEDVDAAIAGTTSKYKMIREHAVCALGNRELGKVAGVQAMQAIVDRFQDRAMTVRYLAAINIRYWKKTAKEHVPTIRKLMRNDPDADVRFMARRSIQDMGFKP